MQSFKYVWLIGLLSLFGISGILILVSLRPEQDNTVIIASILGFLGPTIATILGIMIKDIHTDINSRMTELLDITRKAALAEGKLEGAPIKPTMVVKDRRIENQNKENDGIN